MIAERLPAWRVRHRPAAGLSLWVELPVADADVFAHVAARYGVNVAPGRTMYSDGQHEGCLRISFAEQVDFLDLAVDRLAAAWEAHSEDIAPRRSPSGGNQPSEAHAPRPVPAGSRWSFSTPSRVRILVHFGQVALSWRGATASRFDLRPASRDKRRTP